MSAQPSAVAPPSTAAAAAASTDDASRHEPQSSSAAAGASELASTKRTLHASLRSYDDFPQPGVVFVDILPLFADHAAHTTLIRALELQILHFGLKPDVIVGLDARGFLFGPSLALRIGAGFAPVRKAGKLPGACEKAAYVKEYGQDFFEMQKDGIKKGQNVLVVDDIIATGGSAEAAGKLVQQVGGNLIGFLFILELDFLKGRDKLTAPVMTLLSDDTK